MVTAVVLYMANRHFYRVATETSVFEVHPALYIVVHDASLSRPHQVFCSPSKSSLASVNLSITTSHKPIRSSKPFSSAS